MKKQEPRMYYSMAINQESRCADVEIYGDITSWATEFTNEVYGDMSAHLLSKRLAELENVDVIYVNINSYGGEVAEGLAIYNALRRHDAKVVTRVDGFACSIASVIAMAGDERIMGDASLMMIHNAWTFAVGNSEQLRKQANDLDTITEASKAAYMSRVNIDEGYLAKLMDSETWISPDDALAMGFITSIEDYGSDLVSQSAARGVFSHLSSVLLKKKDDDNGCRCGADDPDDQDDPDDPDDYPGEPDDDPDEPDDYPGEPDDDPDEPDDPDDDHKPYPKASAKANLAAFLRSSAK